MLFLKAFGLARCRCLKLHRCWKIEHGSVCMPEANEAESSNCLCVFANGCVFNAREKFTLKGWNELNPRNVSRRNGAEMRRHCIRLVVVAWKTTNSFWLPAKPGEWNTLRFITHFQLLRHCFSASSKINFPYNAVSWSKLAWPPVRACDVLRQRRFTLRSQMNVELIFVENVPHCLARLSSCPDVFVITFFNTFEFQAKKSYLSYPQSYVWKLRLYGWLGTFSF